MARTLVLDTITEPSNSGTANLTLASSGTTTMPSVNIDGGAIDGTTVGAATPSSVAATTISTTGNATVGGTLGVTGDTTLDGAVTLGNASGDAVTLPGTMAGAYNQSGMTGEIRMWGGSSAPTGWLLCNGGNYDGGNATYAALYAVIAQNFGVGDTTANDFNVPDMRGRMPVGVGTGVGGATEDADGGSAPAGGSAITARSLGEWTGAEVLSTAQAPAHTHTSAAHTHTSAAHTHAMKSHTHTFSTNTTGSHTHSLSNSPIGGPDPVSSNRLKVGGQGNYGTAPFNAAGDHAHSGTTAGPNDNTSDSTTPGATGSTTPGVTGSTGSGSKFTTPIMCVNFIIKL